MANIDKKVMDFDIFFFLNDTNPNFQIIKTPKLSREYVIKSILAINTDISNFEYIKNSFDNINKYSEFYFDIFPINSYNKFTENNKDYFEYNYWIHVGNLNYSGYENDEFLSDILTHLTIITGKLDMGNNLKTYYSFESYIKTLKCSVSSINKP